MKAARVPDRERERLQARRDAEILAETETPRSESFSSHAILEPDLLSQMLGAEAREARS